MVIKCGGFLFNNFMDTSGKKYRLWIYLSIWILEYIWIIWLDAKAQWSHTFDGRNK